MQGAAYVYNAVLHDRLKEHEQLIDKAWADLSGRLRTYGREASREAAVVATRLMTHALTETQRRFLDASSRQSRFVTRETGYGSALVGL